MTDSSARFSSSVRSVLLVDNDRDLCELIARFLERSGCVVRCARSGEEGLRAVEEAAADSRQFGLVIVDLTMPGMGGMTFIEEMERRRLGVGVLVVSGFVTEADRLVLEASPLVHGVLPKPFDLLDLLQRVNECLAAAGAGTGNHVAADTLSGLDALMGESDV